MNGLKRFITGVQQLGYRNLALKRREEALEEQGRELKNQLIILENITTQLSATSEQMRACAERINADSLMPESAKVIYAEELKKLIKSYGDGE